MVAQWQTFRASLPWQVAIQQFNLLGRHDTPRVLTHLGEDIARLRLAATLLFTFPGVPCIYYGDEIGMVGADDPDNRRCMIWDQSAWNSDLRAYFQQLIRLRRSSPALSYGGFQLLYAEDNTVAFIREAPQERLLVMARRAADELAALPVRYAALPDGTHLHELLTGTESVVSNGMVFLDDLPEMGARIWRVG